MRLKNKEKNFNHSQIMAGEAKKWNNTAKFVNVPIIDVTKQNVVALGPVVRGAIIGADYIAIDCVSF